MGNEALFAVSRQGLDYERLRLEAAARNIAIADVPGRPGQSVRSTTVQTSPAFASALGTGVLSPRLVSTTVGERLVHDPSSPMADEHGMVGYPRIDLVEEMGTLVSASRAYEADVRAFNMLRGMQVAALGIGSGQS